MMLVYGTGGLTTFGGQQFSCWWGMMYPIHLVVKTTKVTICYFSLAGWGASQVRAAVLGMDFPPD